MKISSNNRTVETIGDKNIETDEYTQITLKVRILNYLYLNTLPL
jgi:hypothetical protein